MTDTITLIPETRPELKQVEVNINDLPPAETLVGPPPTPELIESIRAWGLLQPLVLSVVGERGNGRKTWRYTVHGGRRRIKALTALADEWAANNSLASGRNPFLFAKAVVVEGTGAAAQEALTIALNATAKANPVAELEAIEALIKRGADEREIAKATGLKVGTIRSRLRLANLAPGLRQALRDGRLSQSAGEMAAKLSREAQEEVLEATAGQKKIGKKEIEQRRRVAVKEAHEEIGSLIADLPGLPEEGGEYYGDRPPKNAMEVYEIVVGQLSIAKPKHMPGVGLREDNGQLYMVANGRRYRISVEDAGKA